jgi:hypothetical protein
VTYRNYPEDGGYPVDDRDADVDADDGRGYHHVGGSEVDDSAYRF